MQGLSGSGKSWLAQRLAREMPAIVIRSDLERRRLAGLAPQARSGAGIASGPYAPSASDEVYRHMAGLARAVLRGARHVIVDAAFLRRSSRQLFVALAAEYGLVPHRARTVAAGAILLGEVQRRFALPLTVARGGIREGAVLALLAETAAAA